MRLIEALRITQPTCIAIVGAGGKTTALFQAAREILGTHVNNNETSTVLLTTSTHMGAWQAGQADHRYVVSSQADIDKIKKDLPGGVVLITGGEKDNLLGGLSSQQLDKVRELAETQNLALLIEADGAHGCPLKAPAEHEPAIPEFTKHAVVMAGLRGLGKPLSKTWVHRPEKFAELSGLRMGEDITAEALARVLVNQQGGLKNIPAGARKSVILSQADTPELQSKSMTISDSIITSFHACIIASLYGVIKEGKTEVEDKTGQPKKIHAVVEPIGGIILAAGGSSRFGEPKQLLLWKGQPLVRHVALAALRAGLAQVTVVVGASGTEVHAAIQDLPVRIVINDEWNSGLSSSIKTGIRSLPANFGGAIFMQADQPQIPPTLIRSMVEFHKMSLPAISAPQIDGQRGNPVLFDASTFSALLSLDGDLGGRALFTHFPVQWVQWHDPKMLIDIDTPEDYERFLSIYPQGEEWS